MGLQGFQRAAGIILLTLGITSGWFLHGLYDATKRAIVGAAEAGGRSAPTRVYNIQNPY